MGTRGDRLFSAPTVRREAYGYASVLVLTVVLPFGQSLALQRYLSAIEFGVWTVVGATLGIVGTTAVAFDRPFLLRLAGTADADGRNKLVGPWFRWLFGRCSLLVLAWVAYSSWRFSDEGVALAATVAGVSVLLQQTMVQPMVDVGAAVREPFPAVLRAAMPRVSLILVALVLGEVWGEWSLLAFGLWALACALTGVAVVVAWGRRRFRITKQRYQHQMPAWRERMREGIPYAVLGALSGIYVQSDIVMLGRLTDFEQTSAYGRAFSLCMMASAGYAPVTLFFQSRIATALRAEDTVGLRRAVQHWSRAGAVVVGAGVIGATAFGAFVLPLFTTVNALTYQLIPIVLAGWLLYYLPPYGDMFHHTGQPRFVLIGASTAAVLNLTLNALWIPHMGALGAAWATLASYLWIRVYYTAMTARQPRLRLDLASWGTVVGVLLTALLSMFLMARLGR